MFLPAEDQEQLRHDYNNNCLSSEDVSRIHKFHNAVAAKPQKTKGAFGKRGTNRKRDNRRETKSLKDIIEAGKNG